MSNEFLPIIKSFRHRADQSLEHWIPAKTVKPARLHQAMRYAVMAPGKRVRPILVYATATAIGVNLAKVDGIAAAVEIIHAYSLIHDDLPAMDDDDLRRGRPTCHREYDEATAILAGDALQALAFYIISHDPEMTTDCQARLKMVENLALFSGSEGMAGGQAIDLGAVGKTMSIAELETMHRHKTGALIRTCIRLAGFSHPGLQDQQFQALDKYAQYIGLSFQIQDDILDVVGETATLGKPRGSDSARNKPTFPSILGLDNSRQKMLQLHQQALEALSIFNEEADILRYISAWFIERNH